MIKVKKIIFLFCITKNLICFEPNNLKNVDNIDLLSDIKEKIVFHNEYEKPFLIGIPDDLPLDLVKKNTCAPHCYMPFNLPSPWFKIEYDRLPYLAILNNYFIDPDAHGLIFNDHQKFLLKHNKWDVFDDINPDKKYNKLVKIEKALHLLQKCGEGYYHFLIEVLPRLILVIDYILKDPEIKLLVSSPQKKFMNEYFNLIGIDCKRIVYCESNSLYQVSELYFPKPSFMGYPSQQELSRIKKYLFNKINLKECLNPNLLIFIERLESRRHVNNTFQIVSECIKNFPEFEKNVVIFDGTSSVKDQIILFSKAKIVIGPHGAGFSNLLFSNPGTFSLEFMPEHYFGVLFWHVASALNQKHRHLVIPDTNSLSSLNVPIDTLIDILKQEINKESL